MPGTGFPSFARALSNLLRQAILRLATAGTALLLCAGAYAETAPTVLYIATERLADIVLGYREQPNVARLGFGSERQPWHVWYGAVEVQALLYLPGYRPGMPVRPTAEMLVGNRMGGKVWPDAFAALASFDRDGNGIVEGEEMRDLYVWFDHDGDGQIANRDDAIRPAMSHYVGFDLRVAPRQKSGHARDGRMAAFSVIVARTSRIHLLELAIDTRYATRRDAVVARSRAAALPATPAEPAAAPAAAVGGPRAPAAYPLDGIWRWKVTNADQWKDATRPWGADASGQLMLAVSGERIEGQVQMVGPYADRINLPLAGTWRDGRALWTSVSPLGLTRSEVRLDSFYGHPVLRGRAWSNRSGKLSEWTWEARRERDLE